MSLQFAYVVDETPFSLVFFRMSEGAKANNQASKRTTRIRYMRSKRQRCIYENTQRIKD